MIFFKKNRFHKIMLAKDDLTIFFMDANAMKIDFFAIKSVSIRFLKIRSIIPFLKLKEYRLVLILKSGTSISIKLPMRYRTLVINQLRTIKTLITFENFCYPFRNLKN